MMSDEIGEHHLTRENKGNRPGEESNQDQTTAVQFENSCEPPPRHELRDALGTKHHEEFLGPVLHEHQRNHDAKRVQKEVRNAGA
jgi:hypothetical protein